MATKSINKRILKGDVWTELDATCKGFTKESNGDMKYAFEDLASNLDIVDGNGNKVYGSSSLKGIPVKFESWQKCFVKSVGSIVDITLFLEV